MERQKLEDNIYCGVPLREDASSLTRGLGGSIERKVVAHVVMIFEVDYFIKN